jgi:hypothetical protein
MWEFCPLQSFLFLWWAVIRRVSAHLVDASCWLAVGSVVEVGRYSLGFGPGVGRNAFCVGQKSVVLRPWSVVCDEVKQLMFGPGKQGVRASLGQLLIIPPLGFEQLIGKGGIGLRCARSGSAGADAERRRGSPLAKS